MTTRPRYFDPNITRKDKLVESHLSARKGADKAPLFSLIEFNLCGLCNRVCVFCPRANQKTYPNRDVHMPVERYESVMRSLSSISFDGTILYSAFSEPLMYKHLDEVITTSRRYCPKARIEIVSNGDLVTAARLAELFRLGLTTFCISMYDGPEQLDGFKVIQKEAGLRDDQVIYRKRWLSAEEHFGITLSNRAGSVQIDAIGVRPLKEPLKQPCYYPFYQVLVDYDGSVLLCAHDWVRRLIAGNVDKDSILDIWNNEVFKRVRTTLSKDDRGFVPCNICDVNGVLIGKDHYKRWVEYYG